MAKMPAFQFYPADWRKDPGVQALSFHDRGVWFEILCLMHESCERGKLMLKEGTPMPEDALSRLLGLDKQNLTNTLSTLINYGVASYCEETGALMCRRMVKDESIRKIRANAGKKGGNPNLLNQNTKQSSNQTTKQKATPSSSSSTSVKENDKSFSLGDEVPPPKDLVSGRDRLCTPGEVINVVAKASRDLRKQQCEAIYQLYPKKVAKPKALQAIEKALKDTAFEKLETATRNFAVAVSDWAMEDQKRFCPHPSTWFNQRRFEDDPTTWARGGSGGKSSGRESVASGYGDRF
ncbi:hypothetical protein MLD52_09055 [Puniceicoccaceae bacterium K14]|nr:hypothetical protein [Puniceicoccaceae bacterium K14]